MILKQETLKLLEYNIGRAKRKIEEHFNNEFMIIRADLVTLIDMMDDLTVLSSDEFFHKYSKFLRTLEADQK